MWLNQFGRLASHLPPATASVLYMYTKIGSLGSTSWSRVATANQYQSKIGQKAKEGVCCAADVRDTGMLSWWLYNYMRQQLGELRRIPGAVMGVFRKRALQTGFDKLAECDTWLNRGPHGYAETNKIRNATTARRTTKGCTSNCTVLRR